MTTSLRQFEAGLHAEHLEEASFLYQQRHAYLHDVEVDWPDLAAWEERLEAHLDGLVIGGDAALSLCLAEAASGDPGKTHAALRVMARLDRWETALQVVRGADLTDQVTVGAMAEALIRDAPTSWREHLRATLAGDRALTGLTARVIGYRRFAFEDALVSVLASPPPDARRDLAWALGRIGRTTAVPSLGALLADEDEGIRDATATALMRLGDDRPVRLAMQVSGSQPWSGRVLGIAGGPAAVRVLLDGLDAGRLGADAVLALGLLGDLSSIHPLLDLLGHEALAGPAAIALNTITGAELHARVFVPETLDVDALLPKEREAYERDGTMPTRAGEPFGNWERRPLTDRAGWLQWLDEHKAQFSRGPRWRFGLPHGPQALHACLAAPTTPYAVRAATYDEFVIRYGLDVPFEADLPVTTQRRLLSAIEAWAVREGPRFAVGRWYFGRELQA